MSNKLLVDNGLVRLVSRMEDGAALIELQVRDGSGWRQILVFGDKKYSSLQLVTSDRSSLIPLKTSGLKKDKNTAAVKLTAGCNGLHLQTSLSLTDSKKWVSVEVNCQFAAREIVKSFFSRFLFLPDGKFYRQYEPLKYCWIPALRKKKKHVIADQIFRSPAVVLCTESLAAAIVPDLEHLKVHRPMPTCLDARFAKFGDEKIPEIGFGFQNYRIDGHTYFAAASHKGYTAMKDEEIRLKFYIYLAATAPEQALRDVLAFLWSEFGKREIVGLEPQTVSLEQYAEYGTDFAMKHGRIWKEFEVNDRPCGGTMALTFAGRHYPAVMRIEMARNYFRLTKLQQGLHGFVVDTFFPSPAVNDAMEFFIHNFRMGVPPIIHFQSWFNNMRTAYGLYWFGSRWGREMLVARAKRIKNLALCAPTQNGVFSTVCCAASDGILWFEGTKAFELVNEYHLPGNAWTACWMLRWYEELERDPLLFRKCAEFADFLLKVQKADGSIPSWVKISGGRIKSSPVLERTAQTAAPALFLARMAQVTRRKQYQRAAELAAQFLINSVIPGDLWFDYETFFSCSKKSADMHDSKMPIPPQNNLSLFWAAELFKELYILTDDSEFLGVGCNLLDRLCLYQQVWDAPYLSINTFGGFGVMNTDAEWNDARQSMFAETLMDYYILTGEREYFERGIAALRASFTLMLIHENHRVAPGNLTTLRAKDIGATYENYAHSGNDRRVPGYIMHDWGSGGAITTAARTLRRFGDFLIDVKRKNGFGINFCTIGNLRIKKDKIEFEIQSPVLADREWKGKLINIPYGKWRIIVNGREAARFDSIKPERWLRFRR